MKVQNLFLGKTISNKLNNNAKNMGGKLYSHKRFCFNIQLYKTYVIITKCIGKRFKIILYNLKLDMKYSTRKIPGEIAIRSLCTAS